MTVSKLIPAVIVLVFLAMPVAAQGRMQGGAGPGEDIREEEAFAPDQGPGGGPPSEERREEIRKKIEAIRIWRLTEELNLDVNTSGRLSAMLSSFDQKRRDIQRERRESMLSLRRVLASRKPDESKLRQLLEKLEDNQRSLQELKNAEIKNLKAVLTIEQQARFMLFQNEFQREMRSMIGAARGRMGRGPVDRERDNGPDQRPRMRQGQ